MSVAICATIAGAIVFYRSIERPMTDVLHSVTGTARARGVTAVAP
jgi:peptidoglycan/LPS O-acetylase OafA/YrhL